MCNCFDENLARVTEHLKDRISGEFTEFEADWKDQSFFLDGKKHVPVNPKIKYSYRLKKKDGTPRANKTNHEVSMVARYCPFCGEDTQADEAD
ncbi:hypothetical protein G3R49_12585 [Shewanella sp. WXL01]|uniref:hypothetical protein n=1 Tax=Shewanella sp. WXL01 TaxID=2709721 RepID=UPI0014385DFD|nr:hypothetical protein [Shewanella sp. WXL01]NKF51395.1 hypothetical protein [Shewanella sp. WXL01]